jgi:phytoene/squalene synthetase
MRVSRSAQASSAILARSITHRASRQAYYTIRWLVDAGRTDDAFRAYAYFRWLDDIVDAPSHDRAVGLQFLPHQRQLLSALLDGRTPESLLPQEQMLSDLLSGWRDRHPGLPSYLENMMEVMEFDAGRRGRLITQSELDRYSLLLATAVMGAIGYFIGHDCRYPETPDRLSAVIGAHIAHMLRDTSADLQAGYLNIPRAVLEADHLSPSDVQHPAYRRWVRQRVENARRCFSDGRAYIRRMGCLRAQIAGYLYCARFEAVLHWIEQDGYGLRARYSRLPPAPAWITRFVPARQEAMDAPWNMPTCGTG